MRLINSSSFEFEDFIDPTAVDYAILSHTWADEEVSYQDMISNRSQAEKKLGFTKIREAARLAVEKGFQYVWIDTCCIDKSSSAELSEAINSMFFWYAQSNVCFAHLADLPPGGQQTLEFQQLRDCRWFSRGWTLQELIAPRRLEFYDSEWRFRGTKEQHARKVLKDVTGIEPYALLLGGQPSILAKRSAVEKMIWASQRETTRPEDMAYCLFGLFGVNMPLLYGEGGDKAFIRLQTAILAATNDLSILAWSLPKDMEHKSGFCQILATSPRFFWNGLSDWLTPATRFNTFKFRLGLSAQVDGHGLRIKGAMLAPHRVTTGGWYDAQKKFLGEDEEGDTATGGGDCFWLWLERSFYTDDPVRPVVQSLGIAIAQVGSVYARVLGAQAPILPAPPDQGVTSSLEELSILLDPVMLGSTYLNRSAAKFSAELPTNIVIHQIDAAPKLIWNSLTESFGLGTAISNQAGYLSLSFRRLERKGGKWGIPSWLDRVSILVPWMNVSGDWTVGPDDPPCPDPWVLACMLRVRYADGRSTPKDWFPYYGRTIRTHFADEEVVLAGVQEMMKRAKHRGAKEVYLGDSSVNEAVLCQLSSPVEKVDGQTTRYHLAVKLLNLSWEHAVEESREYNVPLTDFAVAADLGEINVRDELGAVNGQPPPPEQMGVGVQSPAGQWMGSPAFRERLTLATAKRVDSGWSEGSG